MAEAKGKIAFLRRQFDANSTTPQLVFDVVFGVMLPILCFLFDPIVFRNNTLARLGPELFPYKFFVYLFSGIAILTLCIWLIAGHRSTSFSGVIAGILLTGSVCSLVIGVMILPLTLFGLLLVMGALGFIPFFTSFTYLRNSVRALNTVKADLRQPRLAALLLSGALLISGPSLVAHWQVKRVIAQAMVDVYGEDAQAAEAGARKLRYFGWAVNLDDLVWRYQNETRQPKKDALAKVYKELTGQEIETRLAILND